MPKVGIDPGHGGPDPGAVGPNGLKEKDVALSISLKLSSLFQNYGVKTVLSRYGDYDVDLSERCAIFNRAGVDLVVIVHVNSWTNPLPNYLATFVWKLGYSAEKAARIIHQKLLALTGWPDGGIRTANYQLLRDTDAPAVYLELGFISNPAQADYLAQQENREKLARAIAEGVLEYFGIPFRADSTPSASQPKNEPSQWARKSWEKAVAKKVVDGTDPQGTVTREMATVMLDRLGLLEVPVEAPGSLQLLAQKAKFTARHDGNEVVTLSFLAEILRRLGVI